MRLPLPADFENKKEHLVWIISNNIIFYSDNDYNIISKNINTGKLNWSIKLEFEKEENFSLVSGFFLDEKILFFSTGLGNVYAVDAIEGKIKWYKKLPNRKIWFVFFNF